ncbi:MAG TPA: hypothetical protein VM370_03775 [Candidatus Thermoplasmatota archaeon]|nr:hypothetical protein [Candidatus Thermoplasmatota archaeon]
MAWFLNPWAGVGYAAMLAAWGMTALLLAATPTTRQARILPLLLTLEGIGAAGGFGMMWSTDQAADAYAWQVIGMANALLISGVYLLFVSTLATPLAKPLKSRVAQAIIVLAALLGACYVVLRPGLFVATVVPVWWAPWEAVPGAGWDALFAILGAVSLYAFVATLDARRRTLPGSEARGRATLYIIAFGVRDLLYGILYFTGPLWFQRVQPLSDITVIAFLPGATVIFCLLLGYGVLRGQLFDIDLRIRHGIRRGTLAGVFLAVFFVVATVAENYLSSTYGYLAGGAAAGLLLFAVAPLQRVAERVSHAAIPAARVTPEYLAFRKLEVYKAAVESARETGGITPKERAMLARLGVKLGLAEADARAIEGDVLSTLP